MKQVLVQLYRPHRVLEFKNKLQVWKSAQMKAAGGKRNMQILVDLFSYQQLSLHTHAHTYPVLSPFPAQACCTLPLFDVNMALSFSQ